MFETGAQFIDFIFKIVEMVYGFTNVVFGMFTTPLGEVLTNITSYGSSGWYAQMVETVQRSILGDLYDLTILQIFGGTSIIVIFGLILIKKLVPLA